jgi:RNA polymerase sigma factor (sigma-70 family)
MSAEGSGGSKPPDAGQAIDWADLVFRIRGGEPAAMEQLYGLFARGIRYFILRSLGPDELEDRVHDCFLIVAEAIRKGDLRDPSRLMGFVRTIVKRQIASAIEDTMDLRRNRAEYNESIFVLADWKNDPEQALMAGQRTEIARRVMQGISRRDREILRRFYVEEQTQEQICREMGLSPTQFRLLKSRAKTRFGAMGQRVASRMGASFSRK